MKKTVRQCGCQATLKCSGSRVPRLRDAAVEPVLQQPVLQFLLMDKYIRCFEILFLVAGQPVTAVTLPYFVDIIVLSCGAEHLPPRHKIVCIYVAVS